MFEVGVFHDWFIGSCARRTYLFGVRVTRGTTRKHTRIALTVGKDRPHLEVARGQPYDGRLVQLTRNGGRKRKHLGETVELRVLLLAPRPRRILRLLLHDGSGRLACRTGSGCNGRIAI